MSDIVLGIYVILCNSYTNFMKCVLWLSPCFGEKMRDSKLPKTVQLIND